MLSYPCRRNSIPIFKKEGENELYSAFSPGNAALVAGIYPFVSPCRFLFLRKKKRPVRAGRELLLYLFFFFLVGVSSQTVLCSLPSFSLQNVGKKISLVPGTIFYRMKISPYSAIIGFWGNLLILSPLGFLAPALFRRAKFCHVACGGALLSLTYEILQLPLDRSTDIDDLLLNTAGVILGYLLFLLWRRCFPKRVLGEKQV